MYSATITAIRMHNTRQLNQIAENIPPIPTARGWLTHKLFTLVPLPEPQ